MEEISQQLIILENSFIFLGLNVYGNVINNCISLFHADKIEVLYITSITQENWRNIIYVKNFDGYTDYMSIETANYTNFNISIDTYHYRASNIKFKFLKDYNNFLKLIKDNITK